MNAEEILKSYNLNLASINYLTIENKTTEALLQSLSEQQRKILVFTYIHKLKIEDIQASIGLNIKEINYIKKTGLEELNKIINNNSNKYKDASEIMNKYILNIDTITYLDGLNAMIKTALEALDPIERKVIILRYFEDKKVYEIADYLNYNNKTIYNLKISALKKINKIINQTRGPLDD